MSTGTTWRLTIIDGPTVDRIWDSAKHSQDKHGARIPVSFTVDGQFTVDGRFPTPAEAGTLKRTQNWRITGVVHEDGSGDSLIISGYCKDGFFEGYYKGSSRTGFIEFSKR